MKDNLIYLSTRKSITNIADWIASYEWNAFLTVRFASDDYCTGASGAFSYESTGESIPLDTAIRKIHKNVFYPLERFTHHQIAALGAMMPRTGSEPRHAHYCLRLFNLPDDPKSYEAAINSINQKFAELRNEVCTSVSSVLLTPYLYHKHPHYLALEKNMMRADAIPDCYRRKNFLPLLQEAA